nr:MFS transporter [Lachnospiraceae bacterium]
IMGFGFSMAGVYPTVVSFTGDLIRKYSMAWSFILTMASMGSIVMPSVIGHIAESAGIYMGMSSVALVLVLDLILLIALCRYAIKKEA